MGRTTSIPPIYGERVEGQRNAGYEHYSGGRIIKRLGLVSHRLCDFTLTYRLLVGHHMHLGQHLGRNQGFVYLDEGLISIGSNPGDLFSIAGAQTTGGLKEKGREFPISNRGTTIPPGDSLTRRLRASSSKGTSGAG